MTSTCHYHADRETGRSCTRCGRAACSDCLVQAAVGSQCRTCIRDARPPAPERLRRWNATSGPVVTRTLLALNLAVFVLITARGGVLRNLALFGPAVVAGDWYRLVTSGFVHFGVIHIAFNMLALYRVGGLLEPAMGRTRFLALYGAALLTGSLGALAVSPQALTAGASGAIFGLFGASIVELRRRGIDVWRSDMTSLVALNLFLTFAIPGISVGGHLGGLIGGALVAGLTPAGRPSRRLTAIGVAVAAAVGVAAAVAGLGFAGR